MGRYAGIGFCILQLVISGCIPAAAKRHHSANPISRSATAPLPLTDYIKTVYKISSEGAVEPEDEKLKLLQAHPELSELAACVARDAVDMECRVQLAEAYVHEGMLWSAYSLFTEVLKANAEDYRSTVGLAGIWDQWKDYSMARRLAAAAIAIDPISPEAHQVMGNVQLHRGVLSEAISEFKKSLELYPENPVVSANLGYTLMLTHHWVEARVFLERALLIDASLVEARNNLGIVLANLGDYDGAVAQMQQVGGSAVAFNNLGVVLLIYIKEPSQAVRAFEQALRYDPDYEKARVNLATARSLMPVATVVNLPPRKNTQH